MQTTTDQTGATPGRWTLSGITIYAGDTRLAASFDEAGREMYGIQMDDRIQMPGSEEAEANARLICAAVNAAMEAGYTVEALEAGAVKRDRGLADLKWANADERYVAQAEKDRASLAECREALATCEKYITMSLDHGGADHVPVGLFVVALKQARATLSRLDTVTTP